MKNLKEWIASPLILLGPYIFGLAGFDRRFAQLHIETGILPLYVSDGVLALSLVWIFCSKARRERFSNAFPLFKWTFIAFLSWGFIRFGISLALYSKFYPLKQMLRDFALVYQSLWIIIIFALTKKEWAAFFSCLILGLSAAQLWEWYLFYDGGVFSEIGTDGIGDPAGNYAVSPLFPLSFAVFSLKQAFFLFVTYGHTLFGQFLLYFKKTWMATFLFLSLPVGLFIPFFWTATKSNWKKRLGVFAGACCLGIALSFATTAVVGSRPVSDAYIMLRTGIDAERLKGEREDFTKQELADYDRLQAIYNTNKEFLKVFGSKAERILEQPGGYLFHGEEGFRLHVVDEQSALEDKLGWRAHLWYEAWERSKNALFFGNGFGPRVVETLVWGSLAQAEGKWISGPHNSFLTLIFRTGLLGFFLIVTLIALSFLSIVKSWKTNSLAPLQLICFGSLIFFANFNVCLENPQAGLWFWIFMAACARFGAPLFIKKSIQPVSDLAVKVEKKISEKAPLKTESRSPSVSPEISF